jgi:hypothetical protein
VLSNFKGYHALDARFLSTRTATEIAVDEINESNFLGNGFKIQVAYGDDFVCFFVFNFERFAFSCGAWSLGLPCILPFIHSTFPLSLNQSLCLLMGLVFFHEIIIRTCLIKPSRRQWKCAWIR